MKMQHEFPLYAFEKKWINMFPIAFADLYIRIFFKIRAALAFP